MPRPAQPLEDSLRDAREDADCALQLLASPDPADAALLEAMLPEVARTLHHASHALRRRSLSSTLQPCNPATKS